jgi:hypothetical protein
MASQNPRPPLVRLLVTAYGLLFDLVALGILLLAPVWNELPESTKSALRSIGPLEWGVTTLIAGLNLVGTIQLFRMRRSSFYCYVAALTVATTHTISAVVKGAPLNGALRSFSGFGYMLGAASCAYTWHLLKNRELE